MHRTPPDAFSHRDSNVEERFTQILAVLRRRFVRREHVAAVEEYLSKKGFDRGQIGTIVSAWLSDIGKGRTMLEPASDGPVRIQGPQERGRFSPDAWGYLMGLRISGHISASELEQIIERLLLHVEGRITLDDATAAVENAIGDGFGPPGGPTIVH